MYAVKQIVTLDGKKFDTDKEAKRHLEAEYANQLCSISSKIVNMEKYVKVCEFIDSNLGLFQKLIDLRADMVFNDDNDDERDD